MNINIEADFSDSDRKKNSISMIVFVSNKILKLTKSNQVLKGHFCYPFVSWS